MLNDRDIAVLERIAAALEKLQPDLATVAKASTSLCSIQEKMVNPIITIPAPAVPAKPGAK